MATKQVAQELHVDDMALWRLLERAIDAARAVADFSQVRRVGVDETACRRGHHYVTKFVDLDRARVLFVCEGKGADTLDRFKQDLILHRGKPEDIRTFSCDMSPAFLSGIAEHFPKACVVLDKFHLVKMLNEAIDETRKLESKKSREGKRSRYLWLRNPERLNDEQYEKLERLLELDAFSQTVEACRFRLAFQELFDQSKAVAPYYLDEWLSQALTCAVAAIQDVALTFSKMKENILSWFKAKVSNGVLEGLNSVLQSAKNRARGYANTKHMILMSYLLHGRLDLSPDALRSMPRWRSLSTMYTHTM